MCPVKVTDGAPDVQGSVERGVSGESDGATSSGGRGVVVVAEMGGDGVAWRRSGLVP